MFSFDIVIIGGGASGLMCANNLKHSFSVAIVDSNPLGKKLLATGNGRCNFTNEHLSAQMYNKAKAEKYLQAFDNNAAVKFFEKIGIPSFADEEGRVYPLSESAKDVQSALTRNINAKVITQSAAKISKKEKFEIELSDGSSIFADKVVIACGNKSLGGLLADFNLPLQKQEQVLCGFKVKDFDKSLFGLRENVVAKVRELGFEERGQVQFRKDGISGIVIFNLSAKVAQADCPFEIELELLPEISEQKFASMMKSRQKDCKNLYVKDSLLGILKLELARYVLKISGITGTDRRLSELSDEEISRIIKNIKHLKFICKEKYDDGQVLAGGMKLEDLRDLESSVKGLFFCGEAAGVYGTSGGYNLQWAWSSGYFIADKLNKDKR